MTQTSRPSSGVRAYRGTAVFLSAAGFVLILDQVTKAIVRDTLAVGQRWPEADLLLTRFFTFTHVENTGVAFGMLQGLGKWYAIVPLAIAVGVLVYRRRLPAHDVWMNLASGLIVAGALGNVVDRLRMGRVTDFLDFQVWPVFNVADTAVFVGVVMVTIHVWRDERAHQEDAPAAQDVEGAQDRAGAQDLAGTQEDDGRPPRDEKGARQEAL